MSNNKPAKIPKLLAKNLSETPKTKKRKVRHHASKNFKKSSQKTIKNRIINTEEPTKEDLVVVEELCKLWWNGLNSSKYIIEIVRRLDTTNDKYKKEEILKPIYWHVCNNSPEFKKGVSRALFTYNFILGVPFFKKWIKEEKLSKKKIIKGDLQTQILAILNNCKSKKMESIIECFEMTHFEAEIKGMLTRMLAKEYIECLEVNNKLFFRISEKIELYEDKWYFYKGVE